MKKLTFISFVFIIVFLLGGCNGKVKEYFLFSYTPAMVHDRGGRFVTTKPQFKVESLQLYSDDSVAIASEKKRAKDFFEQLPASQEKEIERTKLEKGEKANLYIPIIIEAYEELAERQLTLIILTHSSGYDPNEFNEKVKEYGINSLELRDYIKKNELEVSFIPLN